MDLDTSEPTIKFGLYRHDAAVDGGFNIGEGGLDAVQAAVKFGFDRCDLPGDGVFDVSERGLNRRDPPSKIGFDCGNFRFEAFFEGFDGCRQFILSLLFSVPALVLEVGENGNHSGSHRQYGAYNLDVH